MDATEVLAEYVASPRSGDLPPDVLRHSLNTFVNFVGCALGGAKHEGVEATAKGILSGTGPGESAMIGRRERGPAVAAALVNGMSGAINAFDDTHAEAIIHPGPPIGAALLSISGEVSSIVSGREFLIANAIGVELACRLSKSISIAPARSPTGWSQTGIAAPAGAAAACARLLGLDKKQTAWAMGIAISQSSGLRVAHGSTAMHFAPAQSAMTGVQAALLARAGVTGPACAIEGRYGFFELFAENACEDYLLDGLGARFEILSNTFKAHPAGIVIQGVVEAAQDLTRSGMIPIDAIAEVALQVPPSSVALCDRPQPRSAFEAQVSGQHWAAAVLCRGKAGLELLEPNAIDDPAITALRAKCRMDACPEIAEDAARITVIMKDGSRHIAEVDHFLGSFANPLMEEGLAVKFLDQATANFGVQKARRCLDACRLLDNVDDVLPVWDILTDS